MKQIYKDYYINEKKYVYKKDLKENKHLMWKYGGVPCIDADNVWDRYKDEIEGVEINTDKGRTFLISKEGFENNKQELNCGFGRQYYVEKDKWEITNKQ